MFHSFFTVITLLSLVIVAQAGGNASYRDEVAPLLADRPDLAPSIADLSVAETGEGTRISYLMSPALAGKRVGPYEFTATNFRNNKNVTVLFRTRERFVNAYGVVVAEFFDGQQISGGDISNATSVQEELIGITIKDAS